VLVHREGENVGGPFFAEKAFVEVGDGLLVDEQHRELGVALHAFCAQHVLGQAHPPHGVDRLVLLFVGGENVDGHVRTGCRLARKR
jgi:hypothetical protein